MAMFQSYQNTNKVKHSFCLNLKLENPKSLFDQEIDIQKLTFTGLPPSLKIYSIMTLASSLCPRQGHGKVGVKSLAWESQSHSWSARECEGMSSHTPKWTPILGVRIPMDSQNFIKQFERSKFIGLKTFLYH
jgi:hypothetical protein